MGLSLCESAQCMGLSLCEKGSITANLMASGEQCFGGNFVVNLLAPEFNF